MTTKMELESELSHRIAIFAREISSELASRLEMQKQIDELKSEIETLKTMVYSLSEKEAF